MLAFCLCSTSVFILCRLASYNNKLPATAAFKLSTGPGQGIVTRASHISIHSAANPLPSFPIITAHARSKIHLLRSHHIITLRPHSRNQPHSTPLQLLQSQMRPPQPPAPETHSPH